MKNTRQKIQSIKNFIANKKMSIKKVIRKDKSKNKCNKMFVDVQKAFDRMPLQR